jgi:hypothetical protein
LIPFKFRVTPPELPLFLGLIPKFPIDLDDAKKSDTDNSDQENLMECEVGSAKFPIIYVNNRSVIDDNPVNPSLIGLR